MNHRLTVSTHELWNIYKSCGPHIRGKVHVSKLYSLGRLYVDSEEDVYNIICLLDPNRKGLLGFKEFSMGVRKILTGEQLEKDSMMSPVSVSSEEPSSVVVSQQQRRTLNGVPGGGIGNGEGASPHPQYELSPPDSPRPAEKSQCSSLSDGESFECYGEGGDVDLDTGPPLGTNSNSRQNDLTNQSPLNVGIKRHTWLRTSLRRSPPSHQENLPNRRWGSFRHAGKRQLGSNALASQLYRSSSFNSSGRSSTCDTADDMYSDASLEEDVLDLNHKFQLLQQQVGVLQDSATHNDERYTRAKADNAALQARIVMLEEQLRDVEMRYEQRLQDEQKRSKELVSRIDREKQLQLENASIRLQGAETEAKNLREEVNRQRVKLEKLEAERNDLFDQVQDLKMDIMSTKDNETSFKEQEKKHVQEQESRNHLIEELSREVERLRAEARTPALPTTSPETLRLEELHEEMTSLRERNNQLQEQNEELQANLLSAGVEQGRLLTAGETSLAAELEAMTHDQMDSLRDETVAKIQQALKEQQDVNAQLKAYIDGILLNIVENYPQLLEVKQQKNKSTKT